MNTEQAIKRYQHRAGFRVADVAEVGLPVYTLNVEAVTLAHKRVPPIEEFLMRCVAMHLSTIEELGAYLGLSQEVLKPALANLYQSENIALTAVQGKQGWALTAKGKTTLESAEIVVPEVSMFPIHFDAVLRKPTLFRFQTLLKYKDLKEDGLIEIEVYPPKRPQVEEIPAADLERILKTVPMNAEQRRDVLAVRSLDSRSIKKAYLRAVCLLFRSLDEDEKQLAFVIDGKQSQEHELAFAANAGFRRSLENLRSYEEKAELRALTEGLEDTARTPVQLAAESEKLQAEATVAEVEDALASAPDDGKDALRERLEEVEKQLAKAQQEADRFEVRNLYVLDHPPLLDDAISTAKSRLMIIAPWVAGKVVNRAFTNKLESLLRKGVMIYIGYGISEQETQNLSPSDLGARKKLRDLDQMFPNFTFKRLGNTHAKVLIKDSDFAAITSFNWLSFKGDPSRTFRDEQGTLIRKPELVNNKFDELVARFHAAPGEPET